MLQAEMISANALKITAPPKLKADDFHDFAKLVDPLIAQHGKIRFLIDATSFHGWETISAFEAHAGFVKDHQQHVERVAIIAGHEWQHWLVGLAKLFLRPEIKAYDAFHSASALEWITNA
jgi:hypothetical protein